MTHSQYETVLTPPYVDELSLLDIAGGSQTPPLAQAFAVFDRASDWSAEAVSYLSKAAAIITAVPNSGYVIGAGLAAYFFNDNFGPVVRESEVALFRARQSEKLTPLTQGQYGFHRYIISREESPEMARWLNDGDENGVFAPGSLINDRGRLSLSNIFYKFTDEPVQTADGAIVLASGAVTFRLNPDMVRSFVAYAADSFADAFRESVRTAIFSEIGSLRRDNVIGHQTDSCARVTTELKSELEGAPGRDADSGLGVIIESADLTVRPQQASQSQKDELDAPHKEDLVSLDSILWLKNYLQNEELSENREFLRRAFEVVIDAARTIAVARELGASGNLIVATPDDTGLTKGVAATEFFRERNKQPPPLELVSNDAMGTAA